MVSILEHCHQYVPVVNNEGADTYSPIPFFGDQLTAVRAMTAKKTRVTSQGNAALRGLVPFCVDWHAKVNFIEVSNLIIMPSVLNLFTYYRLCGHACTKEAQV